MPATVPTDRPLLDDRLARVRFRRAVALMLMTLLAPGSAQLVAGNKRVGRIVLRVVLALVVVLVLVVLLGLLRPSLIFTLMSSPGLLRILRFGLIVLAVGWAALFVDAWRLGQPLELRQKQRLAIVGINGFLSLGVAGALLFASHVVAVGGGFITTMFGDGVVSSAEHGRFNVLLLGGDSGADRWGLRPDSLTVASIDAETGRTILFGLPRNMTNFAFPEGSIMAQQFPEGLDCDGCYLNSLSTWAMDHRDLFPQGGHPGTEATIEGVEGITGLKVNYYAMVNLAGFRNLVDAVGGITLNVRDKIPIGGIGAPITGYIEPGRNRHLDGYQTLWFARSRVSADDYSRMARQKCVMNAMLQQLSPRVVVTKFEKIARASEAMIATDLPASELDRFMSLALKARSQPVATVSFVPPQVDTAHPDIGAIQARVASAIERAQSSAEPSGTPHRRAARHRSGGGNSGPVTTGGSVGSMSTGYDANDSANLASSC